MSSSTSSPSTSLSSISSSLISKSGWSSSSWMGLMGDAEKPTHSCTYKCTCICLQTQVYVYLYHRFLAPSQEILHVVLHMTSPQSVNKCKAVPHKNFHGRPLIRPAKWSTSLSLVSTRPTFSLCVWVEWHMQVASVKNTGVHVCTCLYMHIHQCTCVCAHTHTHTYTHRGFKHIFQLKHCNYTIPAHAHYKHNDLHSPSLVQQASFSIERFLC